MNKLLIISILLLAFFSMKGQQDSVAPVSVSFNIVEEIWQNGDTLQFLSVTIVQNKIGLQPVPMVGKSIQFNGPLVIHNDSCFIYAIKLLENNNSGATGLFLIDDFKYYSDSVTVDYEGFEGFYNESSIYPISILKKIELNWNSLGLDVTPSKLKADKSWYLKWKTENPIYKDERTETVNWRKSCENINE
jgi:hypothetical protein